MTHLKSVLDGFEGPSFRILFLCSKRFQALKLFLHILDMRRVGWQWKCAAVDSRIFVAEQEWTFPGLKVSYLK
jgi:hypothetical protein